MPITISTVSGGDDIETTDLTDNLDNIEAWLNRGVVVDDLQNTSGWIRPQHLPPLRFFRERTEGEATDTYYSSVGIELTERNVTHQTSASAPSNSYGWVPVLDACKTIKIQTASRPVDILIRGHAYEIGGNVSGAATEDVERIAEAEVQLFVNDTAVTGTRRRFKRSPYHSSGNDLRYRLARREFSMIHSTTLGIGTHNIELRARKHNTDGKHFFILCRNLIVEVARV